MKKFFSLLFLCLLALSCIDDELRRPIASSTPGEEGSGDLSVTNLPIHIDSTNYLIHPVGRIEVRESGYYGGSSSSGSNGSAAIGDSFYGNFTDLKFQELNSEEFTGLTAKNLGILSVQFLRDIYENIGKQLLLYKIVDVDTNEDGKLNSNDDKTLYISEINGKDFRKISPAGQVLQDHQVITAVNRLYFRTIEDINANGRLNADENAHYYYLDLTSEASKVTEYFPLGN